MTFSNTFFRGDAIVNNYARSEKQGTYISNGKLPVIPQALSQYLTQNQWYFIFTNLLMLHPITKLMGCIPTFKCCWFSC